MQNRCSANRTRGSIRLTSRQLRSLRRWLTSSNLSPRERLRGLTILLSALGHSGDSIAAVLGTTRRTVTQARTRWRRAGLQGLKDVSPPGRPPLADASYIRRLIRVALSDPRKHRYVFTRWTAPRLAAHMAKVTKVDLSPGWVALLLRNRGLVWRRTKRTIRNLQDPEAVAKTQRRLRRLKKKPCVQMPTLNCGLVTESDSTCCR
jgi:transposase